MKQLPNISAIFFILFALSTAKGTPYLSANYSQGYQDGFIYTAQQTGKGCKNRLSQAATERLSSSVKNKLQDGDYAGDSADIGDGSGDGDGDGDFKRNVNGDYNAGKIRGMGDVLSAPGDGTDLCTNGD